MEARRFHEVRARRIRGLSDAFHETPPAYRAEFLERLIAEGRRNAELRRLVTVRELLRCWQRDEGTGRLHIAHVLDHYCREVHGRRSFEVLNPEADLPSADDLCFPAAYFGPESPPVYEDGSLKQRPCLWRMRTPAKKSLHHYKGRSESESYEWRMVARALNDSGWQRYFIPDELEAMRDMLDEKALAVLDRAAA